MATSAEQALIEILAGQGVRLINDMAAPSTVKTSNANDRCCTPSSTPHPIHDERAGHTVNANGNHLQVDVTTGAVNSTRGCVAYHANCVTQP